MSDLEAIETDVLVIGGGGAGCRAAIEAHDQGGNVTMIVKGRLGHSGCTLNVGTSAAVGPWSAEGDSDEISMRDLLSHGGFLGNQDLAKITVEESPERVKELERWGIDFERTDNGSIAVNRSAKHSYPRNVVFKPSAPSRHDYGSPSGIAIMDTLMQEMSKRSIKVLNDVMLVDLIKAGGRVVGATALDCVGNRPLVFKAGSTILATGTYSQVFPATTVSPQETGDGQAAAFRVGAELIDMESTQFIASFVGYRPGSVFLNANGERFLERHGITTLEGVDKERLCYAVWKEIKEGRGTDRETIFVDMTAGFIQNQGGSSDLSQILENLRKRGTVYPGYETGVGVDPTIKPVETAPVAHTTTGGVRINEKCETTVQGLYAAGAVAGGVYGHARPEGYTSMITLVFGRRAGLFAAQASKEVAYPDLDLDAVRASLARATALVERQGAFKPGRVKAEIRKTMRRHAWVIKEEEGLSKGLGEISEIKEIERRRALDSTSMFKPRDGFEWASALEVPNLLLASEMMFRGSLERRESRGAFFRDDYPETDNENWLKNIIYRQVDGELVLETVPVDLKYCAPDSERATSRAK